MKTFRSLVVIFVLITAGFFANIFCQQHSNLELRSLSILIISGIGLLFFLAGLICWLIFDRWSTLKTELKDKEIEKMKKEFDKKKEFFEKQSDENERRRAFEGRPKPEQQLSEIIKATKLATKKTKDKTTEPSTEKKSKVSENEIVESEVFDLKMVEKIIEVLKERNLI